MILRHIQADADVGAECPDGFQLKAGEFENIPLIRRARFPSSRSPACRCCRPPAQAFARCCRMCPTSEVVVVFPFEPVMPMTGPSRYGAASSTSPMTFTPRAVARCDGRQIERHAGRRHDQIPVFVEQLVGLQPETGDVMRTCRSVAVTSAPRACRNSKAARPDFSIPTTSALMPSVHESLIAVSTWSARTAPAPAPRSRTAQ